MKTIYLLRHGKAEDRNAVDSDFDRTLVKKGARRTEAVADVMKHRGMIPALIVSSPAPRALQTAQVFARAVGLAEDGIRTDQSLYDQDIDAVLRIVEMLDDSLASVMLVGHDPLFSRLARSFAPEFKLLMPKSSSVAVEFDASSWREVFNRPGRLAAFEQPGD